MTEHPFKDLDQGLRNAWLNEIRDPGWTTTVESRNIAKAIAAYLETTAPPPPLVPGWYELDFGPRKGVLQWDGEHWQNALTGTQTWDVTEAIRATAVRLVPDV